MADHALHPRAPEELAAALAEAASRKHTVTVGGRFSKDSIGGPVHPAECVISTRCLSRVLQYEPRDLTISVEAGLPWAELTALLASNRQMIPLDPPFAGEGTVGGVIACNLSGPRRRLYGTARDVVIGMKFATLAGEVIQSGGMVVKNVAGLDMAKLLIGSLGTLGVMAVVNFKLTPMPVAERTFLLRFDSLSSAIAARDSVLKSYLQPQALDLLSPEVAERFGHRAWSLAIQAGGNEAVIPRYQREITQIGDATVLEGDQERAFWESVREFASQFEKSNPIGAVVRASCKLSELGAMLKTVPGPAVARAGSGVVYAGFANSEEAAKWAAESDKHGWKAILEYAAPSQKTSLALWPNPGQDLEVMLQIKQMLDPDRLLNRGRYYHRF